MRTAVLAALSYHDLFDRPLTLHELRLEAPPGAGKTTRVPRALLDAGALAAALGFSQKASRRAVHGYVLVDAVVPPAESRGGDWPDAASSAFQACQPIPPAPHDKPRSVLDPPQRPPA